jgi:hypothetical protein
MIAVLMRDQDGVETIEAFANSSQTLGNLSPAESGIDEYARPIRRDKGRISGTAAGENTNFDDGLLLLAASRRLFLFYTIQ